MGLRSVSETGHCQEPHRLCAELSWPRLVGTEWYKGSLKTPSLPCVCSNPGGWQAVQLVVFQGLYAPLGRGPAGRRPSGECSASSGKPQGLLGKSSFSPLIGLAVKQVLWAPPPLTICTVEQASVAGISGVGSSLYTLLGRGMLHTGGTFRRLPGFL